MGSAMLAMDLGWMGPNDSISTAFATCNFCIMNAANHIIRGDANIDGCEGFELDRSLEYYSKVVFVPDYNLSVAEVLIPGTELSQHISMTGMEASGTSNMKFEINGCIQIGTLDGANVEIREEVGEDKFFLFGAQAEEIGGLRKERT